jgi:hypothetical protein
MSVAKGLKFTGTSRNQKRGKNFWNLGLEPRQNVTFPQH